MKKTDIKDFVLYVAVGGIATLVEWAVFCILSSVNWHYTIATIIAYVISTFVNWMAGKLMIFGKSKKNMFKEIAEIYIASIVGLLLNLLIMLIAVDLLSFNKIISKVSATAIVFFYNFLVRKLLIYK